MQHSSPRPGRCPACSREPRSEQNPHHPSDQQQKVFPVGYKLRFRIRLPNYHVGHNRGLYLSCRGLHRTNSISATRSRYFVKTEESEKRHRSWQEEVRGAPKPPLRPVMHGRMTGEWGWEDEASSCKTRNCGKVRFETEPLCLNKESGTVR